MDMRTSLSRSPFLLVLLPVLLAPRAAHAQTLGQDPTSGTPFPEDEGQFGQRVEVPRLPVAPEPPAAPFGARGQVVATFGAGGDNGAGISYESFNNSQATYLSGSVDLGLDYFFVRNVSVGFVLAAGLTKDQGYGADSSLVSTTSTSFSGGVRLGLNVPLGDRFSFYPRLTLGLEGNREVQTVVAGTSDSVGDPVGAPATTKVGPWLSAFAPVLFHVTPQFFIGVGPRLAHVFANASGAPVGVSAQSTTVEGALVLGGVFGGEKLAGAAAPAEPAPGARLSRFGDQGALVITAETDGYAYTTSYAGTGSSQTAIYVRPGFDVFIADHFSIGLDAAFGYTRATSLSPTGAQVVYTGHSFGLAPRAGLEIPIAEWLSWYPRAEFGFGSVTQDESSAGASNDHTMAHAWVSAEAPLLVHVARHFFVGLGPWASHDLDDTDQYNYTNLGTTFGLSSILGGWL
jgi:hypothetical protein